MDSSVFLIKEYEQLQNESKRKFPTVLKEVKNTIKELKQKSKDKKDVEKEDICEILLNPLKAVFDNKVLKLYPLALSVLGKICQTQYLTMKGSVQTMKILNSIAIQELKDEMMQINVLQICMVCISPNNFTMDEVFVDNSMARLLSLYEAKSKAVSSTAKAALMQLFSHVISDLVSKEIQNKNESEEEVKGDTNTITEKDDLVLSISTKLLGGLVSHLNPAKNSEWPVAENNSTTCLALDLLSLIISEGKSQLANFSKLMIILDEVFDPLLNQMTSMKSDFGISIRLINCITLFAKYIECGLEPLTRWSLTFINLKANTWQKLIAFESFTFILGSKNLVKSLSESNEQCCLANILKVFEQYLSSITSPLEDDTYGYRNHTYQSQKLNKYLEDRNFENPIPAPKAAVLVKLLIECLNNISYQFLKLVDNMDKEEFKHKIFNSQHCNTILNSLGLCLFLCNDEINIQTLLNTYQNMFCIAGEIDNSRMKCAIINTLGKYTSPKYYDKLSFKNILVIRKIFNITLCLSKYLDSKCWYNTFKIMQRIEPIIREELGLKSADEEYGNQLINRQLKKDWGVPKSLKMNQTFEDSYNLGKLRELKPKRKLSHDKEEEKSSNSNVNNSLRISEQSRINKRRKTGTNKRDLEEQDFSPIGRSKTFVGHHRTHNDFHEEGSTGDLYKIDLEQINTSISTLFMTTLKFSEELVKNMILGLGELTVNNVEDMSTSTGSGSKSLDLSLESNVKVGKNLFSLRKLTEIVLVNIYRVEHFWQIIIDQLMVISICNNQDFRSLALEALMIIIIETLLKHEPKIKDSEENDPKTNTEKTLKVDTQLNKRGSSEEIENFDEEVSPLSEKLGKRISLDSNLVDSDSKPRRLTKISLPNEEKIDWDDTKWQIKVLKPFCDSINNTTYEQDQLQIVGHLKLIVEKCFENLNKEGWTAIISSLCSIEIEKVTDKVFRNLFDLLQYIIIQCINSLFCDGKSSDLIGNSNLKLIIECLPQYLVRINIINIDTNTSNNKHKQIDPDKSDNSDELGDFGIIVRIARILDMMKYEGLNETNDEEMWNCIFENIKYLYHEVQSNYAKRKLILHALQDIMINYSSNWSSELWEFVLEEVVLILFERSITKYIDHLVGFSTTKAREFKAKESVPAMQTPTFSFGGGGPTESNSKKSNKKGPNRRMRFDEESIKKFHERSSNDQNENRVFGLPPEETPKTYKPPQTSIEDQELCMFVMDIFNDSFVASELKDTKVELELWILYVKLMTPLISNASAEILKGVLGTIIFIIDSDLKDLFYEKYDSVTLGLFEEINSLIQRKTDLILTLEVTELLVTVYKLIFTKENLENTPQLLNPQNLNVTFHILRINLINSRPTMGLNAMRADNELKEDEKLIFDLIEFMGNLFRDNDDALKYYLSFLLRFISYDADEPHFEMFVRRTFIIISECIVNDQYSENVLYDLIPELYAKTCEIVNLRYHNNSCMSLVLSMKANASLFETAGMFLLQTASHILDKEVEEEESKDSPSPKFFKPNLQIEIPGDDQEDETNESANFISQTEEKDSDEDITTETNYADRKDSKAAKHKIVSSLRAIDEEESMLMSPSKRKGLSKITLHDVQDMILNKIMAILREDLLFDISQIEKHNKAVKDAVIKSSQNLDVQIINFIINSLLPHANKLGKKLEHTLVSIIDQGCNGYIDAMSTSGMNIFGTSPTLLGQSNSLSTYCFDNLFELCSYKVDKDSHQKINKGKQEKLEEIKRKIAKTTVPILLDRCKDTLGKFLYDHSFSTMSLQKVDEAAFILSKLKDLEVYPDVICDLVQDDEKFKESNIPKWNENQLEFRYQCLKGTKAHLFLLIPLFSELITSKEDMIKESLKDIFLEIAKASAIDDKTIVSSNKGLSSDLSAE